MGLAAARSNQESDLEFALAGFAEVSDSARATRMKHFIKGMNQRLDGKYDSALKFLSSAYSTKGEADLHVLRELGFIALNSGDIQTARRHINTALSRAPSNQYVLELAIRIELVADVATVAHRSDTIDGLLERLHTFDTSPNKIYWTEAKSEYFLALNEPEKAIENLNTSGLGHSKSPAIALLQAKIDLKKRRFSDAQKKLEALYESTRVQKIGQRRSILPIICTHLVEAAAAQSANLGAEFLARHEKWIPLVIVKKLSADILLTAAHTQAVLSTSNRTFLNRVTQAS